MTTSPAGIILAQTATGAAYRLSITNFIPTNLADVNLFSQRRQGMIVLRPIIALLSLLPMRVLYGIANILFVLIYHVFTYRRVTVRRNLSLSFPDYSSKEIRRIEREFYRHLADLIVESIKAFSLSKEALLERVEVENMELLDDFIAQGKSVCGILGHMGNWEWVILRLAIEAKYPVHALYQPPSGKAAENWLKRNRERFGAILISTRRMRPLLKAMKHGPVALGTLGDQTPVHVDKSHWMNFLRQITPVYTGTERMARQYDMAVVYVSIHKKSRGHYKVRFDLITDTPNELAENELTEIHTRMLERSIVEQPSIWLWTHRRWKRSHLKPAHFK